jgi:hypothetical protein
MMVMMAFPFDGMLEAMRPSLGRSELFSRRAVTKTYSLIWNL